MVSRVGYTPTTPAMSMQYSTIELTVIKQNLIQLVSFIYLLTNFLPLLPSGSFFHDINSSLFWINFSLMYACNKKTNFFQNK